MAEWLVRCNRNLRWPTHNEPKWFARLIERGEERERECRKKDLKGANWPPLSLKARKRPPPDSPSPPLSLCQCPRRCFVRIQRSFGGKKSDENLSSSMLYGLAVSVTAAQSISHSNPSPSSFLLSIFPYILPQLFVVPWSTVLPLAQPQF